MISSTPSRPRRLSTALVGAGLVAMVSACGNTTEVGATAAPATSAESSISSTNPTSPSSSAGPTTTEDLTTALLPAEAFGPDANVVTVDVRELSTGSGELPPGASVTPEACAQGMSAGQLSVDDFGTIVAQSATSPAGVTVQVLAESDDLDVLTPKFDELLAECPRITATAADGTIATIDVTAFEVPALGDSSAGVSFTTAVTGPGGTNVTVPTLMAVATDGQRLMLLQQTGGTSAPLDPAAFTALFQDAFEAQQEN